MKKRVSILGSTGSIGINTLKILMRLEDEFEVTCLTANTNCNLLIDQAKRFNPESVCIVDESSYKKVKMRYPPLILKYSVEDLVC